jgi:hypothetical protein
MVDDEHQGHAIPLVLDAADRTATSPLLMKVVPDVMALVRRATAYSGVEPCLQERASRCDC